MPDIKTKSRFETLLNVATNRMLSALSAYYIWKWIDLSKNINSPGGKEAAERNVAIMNRHVIIFSQIIISTYKSFVADLCIFFDKEGYKGAFSLEKLLAATQDKLAASEIKELEKETAKIKRVHGVSIKFIRELRDADVAHQEIDSRSRLLLYENIENLFVAVQKILNLVSKKYNQSTYWWDHVQKEVERQMSWIVDNLERGEEVRLKEIEKRWGIKPTK